VAAAVEPDGPALGALCDGDAAMSKLTVAIMAGGKSSRMGRDKAFVSLLGRHMIEHVIERVSNLGQDETILITNRPDEYAHLALPMYTDVLVDKGSLGGIYSAVTYSTSPYTLVVACDMPFVNPELLRYMVGLLDKTDKPFDVIVPRVDGYPEGLHALYGKGCLAAVRDQLDRNQLKVVGFYPNVRVRYLDEPEYQRLDPQKRSFQNVNTPEEIQQAEAILKRG
jgi:molybdopterin-guanine dinucleotide biosynthesis protein A